MPSLEANKQPSLLKSLSESAVSPVSRNCMLAQLRESHCNQPSSTLCAEYPRIVKRTHLIEREECLDFRAAVSILSL